jgi:hypothetical protein
MDMKVNEWTKQIVDLWEHLPIDQRSDFIISFEIIRGFMGVEWLKKHFDPELKKPSIFKPIEEFRNGPR